MKLLAIVMLLVCLVVPAFGDANPWTGTWIWNETPRKDNYFRKVVAAKGLPTQAKIAITADNIYELYINGKKIGVDSDWTQIETYDVARYIRKGNNIIAVKATDPSADIGALLVEGALTYADNTTYVFGTDKTWKISGSEVPGWTELNFNDSAWQTPREIGKPPIGPWSGLTYPTLVHKVPLETQSILWPAKANPGDTFNVTAKVKLGVKIAVNSPVALQLLSHGDPVYEMWIDPDKATKEWIPGKAETLVFKNFRLPIYVPVGTLQARIITNATDTTGTVDVLIGPKKKPVDAGRVSVDMLNVKSAGKGELTVSAKVSGAQKGTSWLFTLYRGKEMWLAQDLTLSAVMHVKLPEGFPGGTYSVKLLPHKMRCVKYPEAKVQISGTAHTQLKPLGYGTFVDRDSVPHRWYVNQHGAMIWDGKPYIPVGAMYLARFFGDYNLGNVQHNEEAFKDDMKMLQKMKEAGVTDLYLNPCHWWQERPAWVWQRFADQCEEMGFNYGIQLTNHLPPLRAYHISQDEYMVSIKGGETAKADILGTQVARPDANSTVYYAAFDAASGEILDHGKAAVKGSENGVSVEATPKVASGKNINVHFIPEFQFNAECDIHDYWQNIGLFKEWMVDFFPKLDLGPNLRLFIDPLDNEQSFRDANRLLPYSKEFRSMFAGYLKQKYGSTNKLSKAWAISGKDISHFEAFARLVPLGTPAKDSNSGYALDEKTGAVYTVDLTKSQMWHDMLRFRDSSIAEFNNEAANALKKYHDIPVVLKATDTDSFVNLRSYGGFDGLGMEAYGEAPELTRGCGGGVYSRCKQANRTMWTITTETNAALEPCCYPDPLRVSKELGSMLEMNGKGTFCFLLCAPSGVPGEGWYECNLFEDPRQLYWLGAYSKLAKSAEGLADYEPEVDYYFPGTMAGEQNGFACSVPSFKSDIPSQSVAGASGKWVVTTSTQVPVDAKQVIVNLEDVQATAVYGAQFEKLLKDRQVAVVGYRKNLGALSIDSYYTNKFVTDKDGNKVQALKPTPTSQVFAKTADGTVYGLTDGNMTLYSKGDWLGAVREMAGKFDKPDFFGKVLGLKELDLGRAFQGMHFGSTTYIWNMQDKDNSLTLELPVDARNVAVAFADGKTETFNGPATVDLSLPAKAAKPVIIQNLVNPVLVGVEGANLAAAKQQWVTAMNRAKEVGLEITAAPLPFTDWRGLYAYADDLIKKAEEKFNTTKAVRMSGVKVDGDISEWQKAEPNFLARQVGVDYAKNADYQGAKFFTGYDDNYIYLAGEINDEKIVNNYRQGNIWNGDALEVFIDLQPEINPSQQSYTPYCFQFLFAPTDKDGNPAVNIKNPQIPPDTVPANTLWAVKKDAAGWKFEAAINRADIKNFEIKPGAKIGFNLQLDDSDGGDRISTRLWRGTKGPSQNRLAFARLVFE